jgi:DNA (cytosine-5)-methyltransferase 1
MVTVISLFAGCGGSSLGYKLAGFKELLAVEFDKNAIEVFKLNFPGVPIYEGDISNLSGEDCMKLANIKSGELDILDGSPPCQGFSISGSRKFSDKRNVLFKEYVRLLKELKPKVFVMENVPGLVKGAMKQIFFEMLNDLRNAGYKVKAEILNAKFYNVPQSRERVIFIGIRNDLNIEPIFPKPQTKTITVREAFKNLENKTFPKIVKDNFAIKLFPLIRPGTSGINGVKNKYFNYSRLDWNKPSRTIMKECPGGTSLICHPDENRGLTIEEAKRLQSFPDDFEFIGTYKKQWNRIGNSVPPNLMRAIALHIKDNILLKATKKYMPDL